MDHMQALLPPQRLLRRRNPAHPIPGVALAAPQPREVQHRAAERQQGVFGDRTRIGGVVGAVAGYAAGGGPDAGGAELDEVWGDVGMCLGVEGDEGLCGLGAAEEEDYEDGGGGGEVGEGRGVGGGRVEGEGDGGGAAAARGEGVCEGELGEEGGQEGAGPARAEEEDVDVGRVGGHCSVELGYVNWVGNGNL